MVISGSGFSPNTNSIGEVYLGFRSLRLRCFPIPLHSTVNQIICKTESALRYTTELNYEQNRPLSLTRHQDNLAASGSTGPLEVTVVSNGEASTCAGTCVFEYHEDWWWHTPRVFSIEPRAVSPGTMITVSGWYVRPLFLSLPLSFLCEGEQKNLATSTKSTHSVTIFEHTCKDG